MSPSKARANEVEKTLATNDIVLFRSPATWTRKARHGTKVFELRQGPKKWARVNTLVSPYARIGIILERELSIGLDFKLNTNPLLQKTFSPKWTMFEKILNCPGQVGL